MIETGLKELDKFLGGGIKDGLITSISGQSATGKTQLIFQICVNALHNGKEILFQDTIGEFRPERLVEMMQLQKINSSLLDKIKVNRITNTAQQIDCLSKISPKRYSLIIVDSVTDLFSFEILILLILIKLNLIVHLLNYYLRLEQHSFSWHYLLLGE